MLKKSLNKEVKKYILIKINKKEGSKQKRKAKTKKKGPK